jgi:hypothetical protein
MMLSLACFSIESIGLPSVVMWGDSNEDRCCGLSMDWIGGEGCIPSGDVDSHARIC